MTEADQRKKKKKEFKDSGKVAAELYVKTMDRNGPIPTVRDDHRGRVKQNLAEHLLEYLTMLLGSRDSNKPVDDPSEVVSQRQLTTSPSQKIRNQHDSRTTRSWEVVKTSLHRPY